MQRHKHATRIDNGLRGILWQQCLHQLTVLRQNNMRRAKGLGCCSDGRELLRTHTL